MTTIFYICGAAIVVLIILYLIACWEVKQEQKLK